MAALGWKLSLSYVGCKLLFYLHRISRGGSIGSICMLSVFQAITISPRDSMWAKLKVEAPKYVGTSLCLIWALCSLVNVLFPVYTTGTLSKKNITNLKYHGYCSRIRQDKATELLHAALLAFPDVLCVGLMLWSSTSMVSILHRHKQQMRHIRRTNIIPRSSPESRATKTILLLVSTYVCFYTLSCIFQVWLLFIYNPSWFVVNISAIVAGFFPTVCPFLLLSRDSSVCIHCPAAIRNRKAPVHMRNG